jgi:hypothetical protein
LLSDFERAAITGILLVAPPLVAKPREPRQGTMRLWLIAVPKQEPLGSRGKWTVGIEAMRVGKSEGKVVWVSPLYAVGRDWMKRYFRGAS